VKCGGLKCIDSEDPGKIGTFLMPNCAQLTKRRKGAQVSRGSRQMVGVMVLLIYEGYNSELRLESQEDFVDTWEREWVVF